MKVRVLWTTPGHRVNTCVEVPAEWLAQYRTRVREEWRGRIIAVYRPKLQAPLLRPTYTDCRHPYGLAR